MAALMTRRPAGSNRRKSATLTLVVASDALTRRAAAAIMQSFSEPRRRPSARIGPPHALVFARRLLTSRAIHLVRADATLEHAALNVYERLDDGRLSFSDCVSFAVMRALDIPGLRLRP